MINDYYRRAWVSHDPEEGYGLVVQNEWEQDPALEYIELVIVPKARVAALDEEISHVREMLADMTVQRNAYARALQARTKLLAKAIELADWALGWLFCVPPPYDAVREQRNALEALKEEVAK